MLSTPPKSAPGRHSEPHERLKWARERKGITKGEAATALGIKYPTYAGHENGTSGISAKKAQKYAAFFGVQINWLLTGQGDATTFNAGRDHLGTQSVQVRGSTEAGNWKEASADSPVGGEEISIPMIPGFPSENQYALLVSGNSMNRVVSDGDYIIYLDYRETGISVEDGDLVVVERTRAGFVETTLKRLRRNASGSVELWPESDDPHHQHPVQMAAPEDETSVSIIGLVIGSYRPLHSRASRN